MIRGSHLIIAVFVFLMVGVTTTYAISLADGHVSPLLCYISYTGNYPVESCIFSAVLSLSAVVYTFIVFLRYVQMSDILSRAELPETKRKKMTNCNIASLLVGGLGVFGLSIAGCFQQRLFHVVHLIGVVLCMYFLLFYFVIQTYFTFVLPSSPTAIPVKIFRIFVVVFSSCVLIIAPIAIAYFNIKCHGHFGVVSSPTADVRNSWIKAGAALEWSLFIIYQFYIFSYFPDFKKIAIYKDRIVCL